MARLLNLASLIICFGAPVVYWHFSFGFDAQDTRWWIWLGKGLITGQGLYRSIVPSFILSFAGLFILFGLIHARQKKVKSWANGEDISKLRGSAAWATTRNLKRMRLLDKKKLDDGGVVLCGWGSNRKNLKKVIDDGPVHDLLFAPTGSGKGVSVIIPTLLQWTGSTVVIDMKGENYDITSGYRRSIGQKIFRFAPNEEDGCSRFNFLAEIRFDTNRAISDIQQIAETIMSCGEGNADPHWKNSAQKWLCAVLAHVCSKIRQEENRPANIGDILEFLGQGENLDEEQAQGDADEKVQATLHKIFNAMITYNHADPEIHKMVVQLAQEMKRKAAKECSSVLSTLDAKLGLYQDPIVRNNLSYSDFCLHGLMNSNEPVSLYLVIPPGHIDRFQPLIQIIFKMMIQRMSETIKGGKHRMLWLLDEFPAFGKIEKFEKAIAYLRGYGVKCLVVTQDMTQLRSTYGRDESITSNCHTRIAFAPNTLETAKMLSELLGKRTIAVYRQGHSSSKGGGGSKSQSMAQEGRDLMSPNEVTMLPGITTIGGKTVGGEALVMIAGQKPIRGKQILYFEDPEMMAKAAMGKADTGIINESNDTIQDERKIA